MKEIIKLKIQYYSKILNDSIEEENDIFSSSKIECIIKTLQLRLKNYGKILR